MPRIEGLVQNTPEWIVHRIGMVTSSRVADVMARYKSKGKQDDEMACRRDYKNEKVIEILTGRAAEHYVTPAMEWGIETEPLAVEAYQIATGVDLEPGGFWQHNAISRFGASPDQLHGNHGLAEFKCPLTATHLEYVINDIVPKEYEWQMLAEMACTGREFVEFVSFDPRLPPNLRLFVKRFYRDADRIIEMEEGVIKFLEEVVAVLGRLASRNDLKGILEASVAAVEAK